MLYKCTDVSEAVHDVSDVSEAVNDESDVRL